MKLGIVGSGMIVQEFLPSLVKLEGLEIVGMQGTKASIGKVEEICEKYGIPKFTDDFDELCEFGIDTVYIAVPNFLHFEFCKKTLEKGLNVIVEKPMTTNYEEAKKLSDLAKEKKLFLFEAITTLYFENYKKIKEWIGKIGDVKLVQSQYSQYSSRYDAFKKGEILPVFDPQKAGGALMDLGLYNLHYVLGLFGKPENVKYYANIEKNIDTSGVLMMKYEKFNAMCVCAKDSEGERIGVIQGSEGKIVSEEAPGLVGKVTLKLYDGTTENFDDGFSKDRVVPEFKAFIRAVKENDLEFCCRQLEKSLLVSEVQTKARIEAGIRFPQD
ncbi:Gfo/Idh/MocA family protein [Leptotrichia trevisanii]|uniref:Gfo/Idh/MocA family protein n=1 Tax=Leptotrichia trevisanii TaxID=109328 RepID=UPI000408104E|nr:Gfo/Idh/MocA family oxidoreductase [Leptotrichia trevisanii]